MTAAPGSNEAIAVLVRPMREADLAEARRIFRVAFGTFLGLPEPANLWPDREYVATRWRADPEAALVAEIGGAPVGSNFASCWGSFGFFGPLTVRPDLWNRRVAQQLLEPAMDLFEKRGVREAGLFTFPHSAKHIALYQKFGFWPRFLTALMSKAVTPRQSAFVAYSSLSEDEREQALSACRELTDSIFEGLDLTSEIRAVREQNLGDTVLLWGGGRLEGFAVCHCGEGTEAGKNVCYIKFAAASPRAGVERAFERLVEACEALASQRGLETVEAGVNLGRSHAYRQMLRHGFRTQVQGVAMHKPDSPGYNRPDVFALDDWR